MDHQFQRTLTPNLKAKLNIDHDINLSDGVMSPVLPFVEPLSNAIDNEHICK